MNKNFFNALKMEKTMLMLLMLLIVLVATFNIISSLFMVVSEKKSDIAILKTKEPLTSTKAVRFKTKKTTGAYKLPIPWL